MSKKKRSLQIPPLSLKALRDVELVERYVQEAARECSNPVGLSVNTERMSRILRTCIVESLDTQIKYYASLPHYRPEWVSELTDKTINSLLGLFPLFTSGEEFRGELRRTAKAHLAQTTNPTTAATTTPKRINRKKLRDSYLARFPDVKILDLCWAARQHYREWKRWIKHELKDGSTPDRAFREVLNSGKRPGELSKKPRPQGWQ
jgi:hypothetical protein